MKKLLLGFIFMVSLINTYAQSTNISGKVVDKKTQEGLPGVSVYQQGTLQGTITGIEGDFSLDLKEDKTTLVFSFVGYETKEISLNGNTDLKIELTQEALQLSEIVVTALGRESQTRDLGYPVQKIDSKEVTAVKATNFIDNLAGKLAGVTVSQGATGVGSTSKITIRGESSFSSNNPLFIVDGTPINNNSIVNRTSDAAAGFQEIDFGNGAMGINPDDIASVSVLKGPTAAALYGTRSANGVIIITTKNGNEARGLGLSINSTTYIEEAFKLPEFQNSYGQGNSGEFEFVDGLGGGTNDVITYSWGPKLDEGTLIPQFDSPVQLPNGTVVRGGDVAVHGGETITPTPFKSYPNNLKDFYETGITTINNIALSSGFNKGNFRLSLSDLRSKSIIPGVNLDRKNVSTKLNFRPTSRFKVNASINFVNTSSDNRPSNGYGSENVNYSLVAWGPRSLDVNALRDYWQPGLEGIQQYSFNYTYFDNPFFIMYENRNAFNRDRLFGNISATYNFTDNLSLMVRSGIDYSDELRTMRRAFSSNRFRNGAYAEQDVYYKEQNTDFLLNYFEQFGPVTVDFSIGANRFDQQSSITQSQALALAQPGIYKLSNSAVPIEVEPFEANKRINSYYGLAKFGYENYLFLEITGRNDWSSALATPYSTENVSFFYPSVSSSFVVSNLFEMPNAISFLKLRASWAEGGNDTNPYATAGIYNSRTPYMGEPTFSEQPIIANANLLPEQSSSIEFGLDVGLLNDRIRFDATYYNTVTENQIISLPVAISSGYETQVINGGKVRAEGFEAILNVSPVRTNMFKWDAQLNFSRNVATIESLPSEGRLTLGYSRIYDSENQTVWFQVEEGGRIGDMYGTGYQKTEDGQFIVNDNGGFIANNELQKLGNYNPDFIIGFNNSITYQNVNLSFLFDWRQGGILVSRTLALGGVGGQLIETVNRENDIVIDGVVNNGTAENPQYVTNTTAIPAETYYRQFYDRNHEENNVYNASYLKLRQLSIGYSFENFLSSNARLDLALIGRNLFAVSEIPHFDPEQLAVQGNQSSGNQFVNGVEDMSYATTRSYGIRIGLNF